jgi:hypothetical protein
MIRNQKQLADLFDAGRTIARLTEFDARGTAFRWATADTNEPVHGAAIKALVKKGAARVLAADLCGDPMQYGAA